MSYLLNPYYEDKEKGIELYLGDCKDVLWNLPNHFAQAIVTDPPYEYKNSDFDKQMLAMGRDFANDINENDFGSGFKMELLEIMQAKLTHINMQFFCNKLQIYDYLEYIKENKLDFQLLEWHKPDAIPFIGIGGIYLPDTEFIVHMFKELKLKKQFSNTWFIHGTVRNKWSQFHSTVKPEKIVTELIRQTTEENDLVIEPFLGTGTTAVCCKKLGRRCIGVEIKEKYMEIAVERLKETEANQFQSELF